MKRFTTILFALLFTFAGFGQDVLSYDDKALTYSDTVLEYTAVFCAEYQAVYDAYDVVPARDTALKQDAMVRDLIEDGIWAKLDVIYVFANNTRANAKINWINPGTFDILPVNMVGGDFVAYRGWTGNGVNGYLRTQFNPTAAGGNYSQNDASWSSYIRTDINENNYDHGVRSAAKHSRFGARTVTNATYCLINDFTNLGPANADARGFYVGNRTAANARVLYKNAAILGNDANASLDIPDAEWFILCQNNVDVPDGYSTKQIAQFSAGASLDEAGNSEVTNFTNAIETYMDYVGAGVISECLWLILLLIPNVRRKEEEFRIVA